MPIFNLKKITTFAPQPILPLKTSFNFRIISLTLIIGFTLMIVNMSILAVAQFKGINLSSESDLMQIMDNEKNLGLVKLIVGINHFLTFMVAPFLFLLIFYKNKIVHYLQLRHFQPSYLMLFPLALLMLYPLMGYLAFFIEKIEFPSFLSNLDADATETLTKLLRMEGPSDLFINLLLVSVLPGIGEELLFRGIIQKEIYQKWNRPHMAIWVTAFVFAVFHFQVIGFLPKMMIGVILGYAYYFSGSLILPMIIHAINNGFATISYYFAGGMIEEVNIPDENIPFTTVLITTLIFALIMYYIYQLYKETKLDVNE